MSREEELGTTATHCDCAETSLCAREIEPVPNTYQNNFHFALDAQEVCTPLHLQIIANGHTKISSVLSTFI